MTFNNNISIESIIFIVIIFALIWCIFRLYREIKKLRDENEIQIKYITGNGLLVDYSATKQIQEIKNAKK